jgi:hypothetical protein
VAPLLNDRAWRVKQLPDQTSGFDKEKEAK